MAQPFVGQMGGVRLSPLSQAVAANRMGAVAGPPVAPMAASLPGGAANSALGATAMGPPGVAQASGPVAPDGMPVASPEQIAQLQQAADAGDFNAKALLDALGTAAIAGGSLAGGYGVGQLMRERAMRKKTQNFTMSDGDPVKNPFPYNEAAGPPRPNYETNRNLPTVRGSQSVQAYNHPYTVEQEKSSLPLNTSNQIGNGTQRPAGVPNADTKRLGKNDPKGTGLGPTKKGMETEFAYSQRAAQTQRAATSKSAIAAARKAARMDQFDKAMRGVRGIMK